MYFFSLFNNLTRLKNQSTKRCYEKIGSFFISTGCTSKNWKNTFLIKKLWQIINMEGKNSCCLNISRRSIWYFLRILTNCFTKLSLQYYKNIFFECSKIIFLKYCRFSNQKIIFLDNSKWKFPKYSQRKFSKIFKKKFFQSISNKIFLKYSKRNISKTFQKEYFQNIPLVFISNF